MMRTGMIAAALMMPLLLACGEEPAPTVKGLRMTLAITQPDGNEHKFHSIKIEIENVSDEAITITDASSERGDLRSALKEHFTFTIRPDKQTFYGQTEMSNLAARSALSETIEPGKSMSITWDLPNVRIEKMDDYYWQQLRFPTDGRFRIQAAIELATSKGPIALTSNLAALIIGEAHAPKACVAKVLSSDPEKNSAVINVGTRNKVAAGDVFWQMPTMQTALYVLTVKEVRENEAVCDVAFGSAPPLSSGDAGFPKKDAEVVLGVAEKK